MKKKEPIKIAVIGGSGLYDIEALRDVKSVAVKTPFGTPSDRIITGTLSGVPVAFLPRHGKGHRFSPREIPQRANIYALKTLGVETVISLSAVGSLREKLAPRHFVFPDQLIDKTHGREYTFFGDGIVAHVDFARPFFPELSGLLYRTAKKLGIVSHLGGTLVCMEGPQYSTKAESEFHRKMGWDLIGMTASPEAKLAREAGMRYSPVSLVTDYDAWKAGDEVSSEKVVATMKYNLASAKQLVAEAVPLVAAEMKKWPGFPSMKSSVFTAPQVVCPDALKRVKIFLD